MKPILYYSKSNTNMLQNLDYCFNVMFSRNSLPYEFTNFDKIKPFFRYDFIKKKFHFSGFIDMKQQSIILYNNNKLITKKNVLNKDYFSDKSGFSFNFKIDDEFYNLNVYSKNYNLKINPPDKDNILILSKKEGNEYIYQETFFTKKKDKMVKYFINNYANYEALFYPLEYLNSSKGYLDHVKRGIPLFNKNNKVIAEINLLERKIYVKQYDLYRAHYFINVYNLIDIGFTDFYSMTYEVKEPDHIFPISKITILKKDCLPEYLLKKDIVNLIQLTHKWEFHDSLYKKLSIDREKFYIYSKDKLNESNFNSF